MKKNVKGFTLIELLIVITILGILSVLGARQFGSAIGKANAQSDQSNAQTIADAVNQAILMSGKGYASFVITTTLAGGATGDDAKVKFGPSGDQQEINFLEYLNSVPDIKANTEVDDWTISVDNNGAVTVSVGSDVLYPVPSAGYNAAPYNVLKEASV